MTDVCCPNCGHVLARLGDPPVRIVGVRQLVTIGEANGAAKPPPGPACLYGDGTATGGCSCAGYHKGKTAGVCGCGHERAWHGRVPHDKRPKKEAAEPTAHAAQAVSSCALAILAVLVNRGTEPTSIVHAAALAKYSPTSGSVNKALAILRARGWIEGSARALVATAAGVANNLSAPLPSPDDVMGYWRSELGECAGSILERMVAKDGQDIDERDLSAIRTPSAPEGYSPTSGSVNKALAKLRRLRFVEGRHVSDDFARAVS